MQEAQKPRYPWIFGHGFVRAGLLSIAGLAVLTGAIYAHYARLTDRKLQRGPFANTANIYAAPELIAAGQARTPEELIAELRRAGYSESTSNTTGEFHRTGDVLEVQPGRDSHLRQEPVRIQFAGGKIARIHSLLYGSERKQYLLDPELITNVSDRKREKRQLVHFAEFPQVLVNAVLAAEDKRFFQHGGFDSFRIVKAAYVDLKTRRKDQGASTLSMQLARALWLDQRKSWMRKIAEAMITYHIEQKLSKQQIFEYYANQVYLGRRGTFSIHGFGEAAATYFRKNVRRLNLAEAAMLAGMVQRPSYYDPYRNPARLMERRNLVLGLMKQNEFITAQEYAAAVGEPLGVAAFPATPSEAPYFVDLVNNELLARGGQDFQNVYTTLDLKLQRAAVEAVRETIGKIDAATRKRGVSKGAGDTPQVALVAIDPRTGAIRALLGGRDYGRSQLNRALAERQPGSVFKPFVFAAALATGIAGGPTRFTNASILEDVPTTFWFNNQPYDPIDFQEGYEGEVTLRQALTRSVNIATVKVAESIGYDKVSNLARAAGLNEQPTPSAALGAYEATPIEMAGAYTIFANQGVYVKPSMISAIRSRNGKTLFRSVPAARPVLDPRVAYLSVNLMEDVMRTGTAAAARSSGFNAPAAGKTGTSRDGWFAGFTSELLCVVWVGFDDNRDLALEGSKSALPIWVEFMKRATQLPAYRNSKRFSPPAGIITAEIDPDTGELATPECADARPEYFIAGTEPQTVCELHQGFAAPLGNSGDDKLMPTMLADQ